MKEEYTQAPQTVHNTLYWGARKPASARKLVTQAFSSHVERFPQLSAP